RETEAARQDTQIAQAETTAAIAQRQQAKAQVEQAKANLETANTQIAMAQTERRELTVGTQLERSALALIRTSTRPGIETLAEAVRLGETLRPFVTDGRAWADYPAIAPLLALQQLLIQIPNRGAVATSGPVADTSLEETIKVWFSADASRYATLHNYGGFRAVYLQFWNNLGEPVGESVEVNNGYGGGYVERPLSLYLTDRNTLTASGKNDLLAIACDDQTICIKDFNQNFEHTQLERVPGTQAAFNPENTELVTLDDNNILRRWTLFEQGQWIGRQTAENQIPPQENALHLTADGRHLWTHDYERGDPDGAAPPKADRIQVFDLAGNWVKSHSNPLGPGFGPSPYLAFSPS
ncbi:MAG: hypothetical protein AAGL17_23670, partial [Cyanobacteria bacterium J06576_12]